MRPWTKLQIACTRTQPRGGSEERPRGLGELVRFAVAAGEQVDQVLGGQVPHVHLRGLRSNEVLNRRTCDDGVGAQAHDAGGCGEAAAQVTEAVEVGLHRNPWLGDDLVGSEQVILARGMDAQEQQHGRGLRAFVGDVIAKPDLHRDLRRPSYAVSVSGTTQQDWPSRQAFNIAEHLKVTNTISEHGTSTAYIKREVPEALKPPVSRFDGPAPRCRFRSARGLLVALPSFSGHAPPAP
jgi:hypothetical protein